MSLPSQARDRILRDAIVLGIKSENAYYKCVEKGSDLTLEETLEIVQSEDSTQHQVEASRQQTQIRTETDVHKFQARQSPWKGAKQNKQEQPKQQSQDQGVRRKSCFMCGATPWHQCKDCPAKNTKCFKCEKVGHYAQVCHSKKTKQLHEMQTALNRLQIQQPVQQHAQPQMQQCVQQHVQGYEFVDCIPSVTMCMLKTVKVKSINCPQNNPHIRPAWLSLEPNSPMQKLNCEVDTGAGCNVLPYSTLKSTFGDVTLKPATVCIIAYDDNAVKVMGSCIIHAHSGKTVYKLECQVTKTEGYFILGRDTAVKMNCVNFPEVKPPQRSLHNLVSTQAVNQESATVSVDRLTRKQFQTR